MLYCLLTVLVPAKTNNPSLDIFTAVSGPSCSDKKIELHNLSVCQV